MTRRGPTAYNVVMLKIDSREIKELEQNFKDFAMRSYPFATKSTINSAAFNTQAVARNDVRRDLVLRNKHTERSIRVKPTRTLKVKDQAAFVGSDADYMERQEFGGTVRRRGKRGVPLATSYAAGLPEGAQPRTKLPRAANTIKGKGGKGRIRLRKSGKRGSRVQRNIAAIQSAGKSGGKFVFLDLGKREGIFKVIGRGKRKSIKMVHDLSHDSVETPRNPWLLPSVQKIQKQIPKIYLRAMIKQAKRNKLFGY